MSLTQNRTTRIIPWLMALLNLGLLLPFGGQAAANPPTITRQHIQTLFEQQSGNATHTATWRQHYRGKPIAWQGTVYEVHQTSASKKTPMLKVQVLSGSFLYDTIVVLPHASGKQVAAIAKGDAIRFTGTIIDGVDLLNVKQVKVQVRDLSVVDR